MLQLFDSIRIAKSKSKLVETIDTLFINNIHTNDSTAGVTGTNIHTNDSTAGVTGNI